MRVGASGVASKYWHKLARAGSAQTRRVLLARLARLASPEHGGISVRRGHQINARRARSMVGGEIIGVKSA